MKALYEARTEQLIADLVISEAIPNAKEITSILGNVDLDNVDKVFFSEDEEIRRKSTSRLRNASVLRKSIYFMDRKNREMIKQKLKFCVVDYLIYSKIVIFNCNTPIALLLLAEKQLNISVEEDGTGQLFGIYQRFLMIHRALSFAEKMKIMWGLPYGMSQNIREFITSERTYVGKRLFDKPIIYKNRLNIDELGKQECQAIQCIFGKKLRDILPPKLNNFSLLLAVHLAKEGRVENEEEEINIYKLVITKHIGNKKSVLLKPHPKSTTNFHGLDNCTVLPANFPVEILPLFCSGN